MKPNPVILAATAILMLTAAPPPAGASVIIPKTLERTEDPVIIEGKKLPQEMLGYPIENYGLYSFWDASKFTPIPFQIDEKLNGDYVFPFGPKATRDSDGGRFDADDELVFMVKDTGNFVPQHFWPKGVRRACAIELTDPLNGKKAWAFLFLFDKKAPRSYEDYVRYEHATETIYAKRYVMAFHRTARLGFGHLAITRAGNGRGGSVNTVDRLKIRFEADTLFGVHISRNEEEFTSKTVAWIDGPVRVIRRVHARIILFWKIPSPAAKLNNVYYSNAFEFPVRVDLPFEPRHFIKNSTFRVSSDGLCNTGGKRFYNSRNRKAVIIDGKMSEAEKNLDLRTYTWMLATGDDEYPGGWLNRLFYDKKTPIHPTLYYMDDKNHADPPEDDPGECGDVGYVIKNLELLGAGGFELLSVMYQVPNYQPGDEVEYLNIVDHPLKVDCKLMEPLKKRPVEAIP